MLSGSQNRVDLPMDKSAAVDAHNARRKKKKTNHSQLGADFVAPEFESSWSWFIIVAAGFSNVRFSVKFSEFKELSTNLCRI